MKKLGFTLAEVLVTLAIVGFIASVTLPTLQVNVQKQQVAPALLKAINTLETANIYAIQEEGVRSLASLDSSTTPNYFTAVSKYLDATEITSIGDYYTFSLSKDTTLSGYTRYNLKDGTTILYKGSITENSNIALKHGGKYWTMYIDTNGQTKKPNALGRDVFLVYVDTKGAVIPYGGAAYKSYLKGDSILWSTGCNKRGVSNVNACAGSVADNNGVIYPYKTSS